ncbi:MAG: GNAT family N-acetyltransferase, partial [Rhodospirillales bacterium]
ELILVRIFHADRMIGYLPLHRRKARYGWVLACALLSFPSHPHVPFCDMAVTAEGLPPALLPSLIGYLENRRDLAWLNLFLRGTPERSRLRRAVVAAGLSTCISGERARFLIDAGLSDRLPKKLMRNIRRLRQRAESDYGTVRLDVISDPSDMDRALDLFLDLEASGWKGAAGTDTAIKGNPTLLAFYRGLVRSFGTDGAARIAILWFGDRPAAAQLALVVDGIWSILKIGYQEAFKDQGPGVILLKALLERRLAAMDVREVSLVTSPEWARRWHCDHEPLHDIRLFRKNALGQALRTAYHLSGKAKGATT